MFSTNKLRLVILQDRTTIKSFRIRTGAASTMMVDGFHRSQADAMILAATRRSAANCPQVGHTCEYLDALFSKQNNTEVGHTCEYLDALFSKHLLQPATSAPS